VIPVSITFQPDSADRQTVSPPPSQSPEDHPAAAGCAWLAAWAATWLFAAGAVLLIFVVVSGSGGPYGVTALIALFVCGLGAAALGTAAVMWAAHRLLARSRTLRTTATLAALAGGIALFTPVVGSLLGWVALPGQTWPIPVAGVTLLSLASILGAERTDRRPALVFAAVWLTFLGTFAYRAWTEVRVQVVWLGPSIVDRTPGQIAFSATRSGDVEIRFGAHWCWDGRVLSTGRYEWGPGDPRSSFGAPMWVDLPSDVLPLERGDLVRVCLRDGLAAGTAAGEAADPPSFWPRD
jgi:hypothetical protein